MAMEEVALEANGWRFRALIDGPSTGELVLLLHGFPEFSEAWSGIMPAFAAAKFRAVAVDQRGYSPGARPARVEDYSLAQLCGDVLAFAGALGAERFHLVGHDWGGLVAWHVAARTPERLRSLTVLSTPHHDAFVDALENDKDQRKKSRYITFFRMPGGAAEAFFKAFDWKALRSVYEGKLPEHLVKQYVRRFAEPGALTSALNWYRALDTGTRIGPITVPTLYIWGSDDLALGERAATSTAQYVTGKYAFERLDGKSHWLQEEAGEWLSARIVQHLTAHNR